MQWLKDTPNRNYILKETLFSEGYTFRQKIVLINIDEALLEFDLEDEILDYLVGNIYITVLDKTDIKDFLLNAFFMWMGKNGLGGPFYVGHFVDSFVIIENNEIDIKLCNHLINLYEKIKKEIKFFLPNAISGVLLDDRTELNGLEIYEILDVINCIKNKNDSYRNVSLALSLYNVEKN